MNPNFTWAKGYYDRDLTDEQREELVDHRGGCSCCISPPCWACSEPITLVEAVDLGWLSDEELEAWTNDPGDDPKVEPQVDYMKAVRDMCR